MDARDAEEGSAPDWGAVFGLMVDEGHLMTGEQLPVLVDRLLRPSGLTVELFLVDLAQRLLKCVGHRQVASFDVEGTLAGRCYQFGEVVEGTDAGRRLLWVPVLDGTDRVGVLRVVVLSPGAGDEPELPQRLWTLAGLLGHVVVTKIAYGDELRMLISGGRLTPSAELFTDLLPPRTFATENLVVSALLEPFDRVAGDAYDYAVTGDRVDIAVFDGVGHDMTAAVATTLALTAVRNARRGADRDLLSLAAAADRLLTHPPAQRWFVTAVLARLDGATGVLEYLVAGHPPPVLIRRGRAVRELAPSPRPPLGVVEEGMAAPVVSREQLEPGDRIMFYSDGVSEARDAEGEFFGEQRLIDFAERAELDQLSAPETLRRLGAAVLRYQGGRLQDDATLMIVDWTSGKEQRLFPTFPAP
ncbi:MAG TPA: PP2C family protein-serine/threonine phosphatase [Pseudonocardia sp.]